MEPRLVVYQLKRKFVNQDRDIPENARQVLYYSLAIGHHVGVIDCLFPAAEIPLGEFAAWLECLPPGPARQKLAGALEWGEIEIGPQHAALLRPLLQADRPGGREQPEFAVFLRRAFEQMAAEPALYLMIRKMG